MYSTAILDQVNLYLRTNENPQHFIHEINTIAYDVSDVNLFLRK